MCVALNRSLGRANELMALLNPVATRKVLTDDVTAGVDGASSEFSAGFEAGLKVGETDLARDILKLLEKYNNARI
jgi:hypothetical protein